MTTTNTIENHLNRQRKILEDLLNLLVEHGIEERQAESLAVKLFERTLDKLPQHKLPDLIQMPTASEAKQSPVLPKKAPKHIEKLLERPSLAEYRKNPGMLERTPHLLQTRDIVRTCVTHSPRTLQHAAPDYKSPALCAYAALRDPFAMKGVPFTLPHLLALKEAATKIQPGPELDRFQRLFYARYFNQLADKYVTADQDTRDKLHDLLKYAVAGNRRLSSLDRTLLAKLDEAAQHHDAKIDKVGKPVNITLDANRLNRILKPEPAPRRDKLNGLALGM